MERKSLPTKQLLMIAGIGWLFDAMDVGLLSFINAAIAKEWDLTPEQVGWIGSVNSIGMAVGAFLFGAIADKVGRRNIFVITLLLFSLASGLSAFATGLTVFLILRFFIGMGLGGELPVAATLVNESVAPEVRGKMVVLLESFWAVGWIAAAVIAYFVIPQYGWQAALLLGAVPALYAVYLRTKLPESPTMMKKEMKTTIWQNIRSVWAPQYAKSTSMLWILWFTVVFSYYGMFLWLPSVMVMKGFTVIKSFEYVLMMTLAQLPGYFSAAWLIERFGRKFVLVVYLLGTAASAYVFGQADTFMQLMVAGSFLSFFNLGAWGALYAYTPEQYPTEIRTTGAGMAAAFGRIGGILGPLAVGYFVTMKITLTLIFFFFALSILVGVCAVVILGKETNYNRKHAHN